MKSPFHLAFALACLLPLPAWADCAERIAAVENHPAVLGDGEGTSPSSPEGGAESLEDGASVREEGGKTKHAEGGPAAPSESWFTTPQTDDKGSALTYLDAAKAAHEADDEAGCLEAVRQAEAMLENG